MLGGGVAVGCGWLCVVAGGAGVWAVCGVCGFWLCVVGFGLLLAGVVFWWVSYVFFVCGSLVFPGLIFFFSFLLICYVGGCRVFLIGLFCR